MSNLINYDQFKSVFEQMKTYIDSNIQHTQELSSNNSTAYTDSVKEEIYDKLANEYASLETFQNYSDSLSTSFQLLQYGMNLKFESTGNSIDDVYEEMEGIKKDLYANIKFDTAGLVISQKDSPYSVDVSEKEITFMQDKQEIVKIANNKLIANKVVIDDTLDLGAFRFIPKRNGHLSLSWNDDGNLVNYNYAYPGVSVSALANPMCTFILDKEPVKGEYYTLELDIDVPDHNYAYDVYTSKGEFVVSVFTEQFKDGIGRKSFIWNVEPDTKLTLKRSCYRYINYIQNGRFNDLIPGSGSDKIPGWKTDNADVLTVYHGQGNENHRELGMIYLYNESTTDRHNIFQSISKDLIPSGTEITVSFDIDWQENTKGGGVWLQFYDDQGNEIEEYQTRLNYEDGEFKRGHFSVTMNTPDVNYDYMSLFCVHYGLVENNYGSYILVSFGNVKLEIGSAETKWSESPNYEETVNVVSFKLYPGDEYWDNSYNLLSYNNMWNNNTYVWNEHAKYIEISRNDMFEQPTSLYARLEPDTDYMFSCKTDCGWGLTGYNYIEDGGFSEGLTNWRTSSNNIEEYTDPEYNKENTIYLYNTSSDRAAIFQRINSDLIAPGTEITVSFDIDWESNVKDCEGRIQYYSGEGEVIAEESVILNKVDGHIYSGHVETTLTTIDNYSYFNIFFVHVGCVDNSIEDYRIMTVSNVKLEVGDVATDFNIDTDSVFMRIIAAEDNSQYVELTNPCLFRVPSAGVWKLNFYIVKGGVARSFWDAKIAKVEILNEEEFVNEGAEDILEDWEKEELSKEGVDK